MKQITGEKISRIPRTDVGFKTNPHLRLIRELWLLEAKDETVFSAKQGISLCLNIQDKYKKSIARNNQRILDKKKDIKKWTALDPKAYAEEIVQGETDIMTISNANSKLRGLVKQLSGYAKEVYAPDNPNSKAVKFVESLMSIAKLKNALRAIAKDEEIMEFIDPIEFETPKDLQKFLSECGIGDTTKHMKDMITFLEMSSRKLVGQLPVIKEFVRQSSEENFTKVEEFMAIENPTIGDVVAFVKSFRKFYISIRENEDFIKIDGLTEDLAEAINGITSTSNMLNAIGFGNLTEENIEALDNIAKAGLAQGLEKLSIAFYEVNKSLEGVFDEKIEDPVRKGKLRYLLLTGAFLKFDLSAGMMALNLIDKMSD